MLARSEGRISPLCNDSHCVSHSSVVQAMLAGVEIV